MKLFCSRNLLILSGFSTSTYQHCWTPLLLSAKENAADIVNKLLDRKPNVNATDKDGCAALTLACKEGYYDICMALLNAGAYVNLQVNNI